MAKKATRKKAAKRAARKPKRKVVHRTAPRPAARRGRRVPAEQGKGRKSAVAASAAGEVGYGRPPVEHQFRPGQSGNPAGTPPARSNLWRHICRFLELPEVEVRAAARDKSLPANQRIAAKQALQLLAKGFTGVALQATMRMWDRDEGRPTAHVVMESADVLTPAECDEIREQLRKGQT